MSRYIERVRELFDKSPVVDFKSIERIAGPAYAKLLLYHMRGEIKRITKGCYSREDDPTLAVLCFQPAYLGLQSALSFHGLWEQETIPIIVTSRRVRTGIRQVLGSNVLIRRSRYIFGYEFHKDGTYYVPYSDLEKTFIDMELFGERIAPEVLAELKDRLDADRMERYLKRYPKHAAKQVRDWR